MKYITKLKLRVVQFICDQEDKSTEYMLQAMQDIVKVDLDCVINYLEKTSDREKSELYNDLTKLIDVIKIANDSIN